MTENAISSLQKKVENLTYFSEGEFPVTPFIIDVSQANQIPEFLAVHTNAEEKFVKKIPSREFFARFKNYLAYNGPDEIMNENARQFMQLQNFLKENFETTIIYRVEKPNEAVIPIFIICKLKDNKGFAGLKTTAIET